MRENAKNNVTIKKEIFNKIKQQLSNVNLFKKK